MKLSLLQKKDVINISDGTKIGNIIDIKIDPYSGKIDSLVIEKNGFSGFFTSDLFASATGISILSLMKRVRYCQ